MASAHARCVWMLALGLCAGFTMGTDCGRDCALCVYRSLGQQTSVTPLTCSLECEGALDAQRFRLCRDALLEDGLSVTSDPQPQEQEVATSQEEETSPEHQLAKKYGGFMKRYGGFMSRRAAPSGALEDSGNQEEEEKVRMEILKILNAEAEGGEGGEGGEVAKRYGGFMRRAGAELGGPRAELLEAVLGRGLKKRYGGFMRRVGRPEWLLDDAKGQGGALKRAWEGGDALKQAWDGGDAHKRYGGFMD